MSNKTQLIDGVQGNESKLRFIAACENEPTTDDLKNTSKWLRTNVFFILAPADQGKDSKDHNAVLEEARAQGIPANFVVSAGYVYSPEVYNNEMKRPDAREATTTKLVFGSDALRSAQILTAFDVAYQFNNKHYNVKSILQQMYLELTTTVADS